MKMPVRKLSSCVATGLLVFVCAAHAADATYYCTSPAKGPFFYVTASSQADAEKKATANHPLHTFSCTKR